ncbi:hypothetical protein RF11_07796 [Thelohanellus kitauei]|uniref:CUB domain-containing protein n=1 Tax=Thelohanellus kitauei TaxID=669202 RepID=A0A0C2NK65_THEKT|nr:hypothetical protein RF11_07796 [Thelohanellus kitauei]
MMKHFTTLQPMFLYILPLYLVNSKQRLQKTTNKERVMNLSLENTNFNISLNISIDYISSDDHKTFFQDHITKFSFNNSKLIIKLERSDLKTSSKIKCTSIESETEVEISGCNLSFKPGQNRSILNFPIGYRYIFKTNKKYEFSNHTIMFDIDESGFQSIQFILYHVSIEFEGYTQKCELNSHLSQNVYSYFNSTDVIRPCESGDGKDPDENDDTSSSLNFYGLMTQNLGLLAILISVFLLVCITASLMIYAIVRHRRKPKNVKKVKEPYDWL